MSKFLANLFLVVAGLLTLLGNYWFTYGLWPKSWSAFIGFWLISVLLMAFSLALSKEDQ